jgi:Protein of unknown function (DUF2637)
VTGDKLIRFATSAAVTAVAAIAATVSYSHVYDLGRTHGQSGVAARLLPLSVDGLILAASLTLLLAARNGLRATALPRFALWLGIGGTIAANLAYGFPYGPVGAVLSVWPGAAFVLGIEILLGSLRRSQGVPQAVPVAAADAVPEAAPATGSARTRTAPVALSSSASRARRGTPTQRDPVTVFAAELERGELPGIRSIKRQCHVGQDAAAVIKSELEALLQRPVSEPAETMA